MSDAPSSKHPPLPDPPASGLSLAALLLIAQAAQASAAAEADDPSRADPAAPPAVSAAPRHARTPVARRRRQPIHRPRTSAASAPPAGPSRPPTLVGTGRGAEDRFRPETRAELRDWIKDNATLLSNASLLISLSAVALNLLPDVGIFSPYIKALLFAAALLLLTELHHQWPEDLQLQRLRKNAGAEPHSWRMTAFALVLQVATLIFAAWATLTNPIILLPLTALGIIVAFHRWYFRRYGGLLARSAGIIALVGVLLLSELLMVVVWAAVTGEQVTLELWAEDRPGVQLHVGP